MEWLSKIFHRCESMFNDSVEYAYTNPKAGYLIVIFILSVWLVGLVFDWKWTYMRPGNWNGNFLFSLLGPTTFRFCLGFIITVALVVSLFLYFKSK